MLTVFDDKYFMKQALQEAQKALEHGEVPIGAVIVSQNRIIAKAYNQTELLNDVTAHAEMLAITSATSFLGNKYLNDCTLYVTLEPCTMCGGALFWSKIGRVVFGATDEKKGFMCHGKEILHPKTKIEMGLMMTECEALLEAFFAKKR